MSACGGCHLNVKETAHMAKKTSTRTSAANGTTLVQRQKSNRFNLKIVLLELKALYPILSSQMDDETREVTEKTLLNCAMKLEVIARYFADKQPTVSDNTSQGVANV
jgi:hypothetical protein